ALAADRPRLEVDLDVQAEPALGRKEGGEPALVVNPDRPDDLEIAARPALLAQADGIDGPDKVNGGAVHDRRLRPINFDQDIVDPKPGKRRQKMLDRRNAGAGRVADHGAKRRLRHIGALGLEQAFAAAGQSGAQEDNTGVDMGWVKD